jgi:integrase
VLLRRVANLACKKGGPLKEHSLEEVGELLGQIKRTHGSEAPRRDAWTKEEAGVLLDLAKERAPLHYGPLLCAFSTGARQGEILGLEWPQVDLARGEIHFSAQLNRGQRKLIKWDRKGKGRRAPISPQLAAHLRELQKGLSPFEQQGPVFRSPTGKAWNARYFARGFDRLIRWAHRGKSVRLLTWHSTRHSFISWALEAGHQVLWVSEIVGAKPPVIFSNYAHVIPQEKRDLSFCAVG